MRLLAFSIGLTLMAPTLLCAQQTVGVFENTAASLDGYSLFTVSNQTYLIDNCGNKVNQWQHSTNPGLSAYLTHEGTLIRCGNMNGFFFGGGTGGLLEEYDWNGNLIWSYEFASIEHHQHHDIEPMPNGNILVIAWEARTAEEAEQAGAVFSQNYSPLKITEIEKVGVDQVNVIWEWRAWDHLIQQADPTKDNFGVVADHPELIDMNAHPTEPGFGTGDWQHANGIDYNEERDEIAVSIRGFHEVWVIDHSTTTAEAASHEGGNRGKGGDLLYRWGNPENYGAGDDTDRILYGQHDVKWIPEGHPMSGSFCVFNNGNGQPGVDFSSVLMFTPPLESDGSYSEPNSGAFGPPIADMTFMGDPPESIFSINMGGAQPLPNGNVIMNSTTNGRTLEFDINGQIVWEYRHPISMGVPVIQGNQWLLSGGSVFRIERYPADYPAFVGRDMTPGETVEVNAVPLDCTIYTSIKEEDELLGVEVTYDWNGRLIIRNENFKRLDIRLMDVAGNILNNDISQNGLHTIDVAKYSRGMYVLVLMDKDDGRMKSIKFINH